MSLYFKLSKSKKSRQCPARDCKPIGFFPQHLWKSLVCSPRQAVLGPAVPTPGWPRTTYYFLGVPVKGRVGRNNCHWLVLCVYQSVFPPANWLSHSATKQVFGKQGFPRMHTILISLKMLKTWYCTTIIGIFQSKEFPGQGAGGYGMGQLRVKALTGQTDGLS